MPHSNTSSANEPQFSPEQTAKIATIMERFDRRKLDAFVEVAIDLMDGQDGDADEELNGDEADTTFAEDEEGVEWCGGGAGCACSDPDGPSAPEWHTLGSRKARQFNSSLPPEDAEEDDAREDDDPAGGNVTDEPHDEEPDAEVETWAHPNDHPAGLFIRGRTPPSHTYGVDQRRWADDDNPEAA